MVTAERLRELLSYDSKTGTFVWRVSKGTARAGRVAGCVHHTGYVDIRIDGCCYRAHRLAWLYVFGRWPIEQIDHIDGDGTNNRFANLREATHAENARNARKPAHNTSTFKGVAYVKRDRCWRAYIRVNRKAQYIGDFAAAESAARAYDAAALEHHGAFARLNFPHVARVA